ncbi:3'-5' exoribonuclease YhaM family protein [Dethiosulfatarculus sandiegensis]|uniref:HD family phosphohydrolase n=1 Tax=Dethiosulfatarculus sandiegensis TaxID=1429043 RepID=A0A0D2J4U4_9BACT|nr:HD domain-containing protein [Dethiosulfatarculus sandiegensis]KIX10746.1 HD family phosphohydrolase [Dethiosulfatarculus sandiegensis]
MSQPELAALNDADLVSGVYLLSHKQLLTTKTGKPYGSLKLQDPSAQVEARLWDRAEELLTPLKKGMAVKVQGKAQLYAGKLQVIVNELAEEPNADPALFMAKSPVPFPKLQNRFNRVRNSVKDRKLKNLLSAFFSEPEFKKTYEQAPAAKGAHHAYLHGLLEHSVSVAEMARKMGDQYPELERDLLVTAALLHDVGKTKELTLGPPIDYTDQGRLEGHIAIGAAMLDQRINMLKDFPCELAQHLRHLILSHHGCLEFGSPVKPLTAEAMMLSFLDDMDAKMAMYRNVISENTDPGNHWSGYNRLLERFLYTGPSPLQSPSEPDFSEDSTLSLGLFNTVSAKGEGVGS